MSFKCFMQILALVKGPGFPSMERKVLCLFTGAVTSHRGSGPGSGGIPEDSAVLFKVLLF